MTQSNLDDYQTAEQCGDCGQSYESLAVHHGMTDCGPDSHKSEYECATCGSTFERYDSGVGANTYCSNECRYEGIKTGVEKECKYCGTPFYKPACHEGEFCSPECTVEWRRESDEWSESQREKVSNKVEVNCDCCGEVVERRPSEVRENVYCSDECLSTGLSKMKVGEKNPNFKHGYRRNPVSWIRNALSEGQWREKSKQVRGRADGCEICGEASERLEAHHIVPVIAGGTNADYNLLALCPSCHNRAEGVANEYSENHLLAHVSND